MKRLKNPTDKEITIIYRGNSFTLPASGELDVADEVAIFWKRLHAFLTVEAITTPEPKPKVIEEQKDEVKEEPKTGEEKPEPKKVMRVKKSK